MWWFGVVVGGARAGLWGGGVGCWVWRRLLIGGWGFPEGGVSRSVWPVVGVCCWGLSGVLPFPFLGLSG